jgi:hypothetical protein
MGGPERLTLHGGGFHACGMLKRRDVLAGMAALPLAQAAVASDYDIAEQSAWDALTKRGLYLPILREPRGIKRDGLQLQAQFLALVGDENGAFRTMPGLERRETAAPSLEGAKAEPALEAIVRAAKDRQIVVLNEAHYISRCRTFALDVALALREQGFEIFAAEALNDDGEPDVARLLNAGEPATTDFGLYPDDPVYAELLRGAREAGYRFAAYETRYDQISRQDTDAVIASREQAEADNFVLNVLQKNSKARVFVYCGYTHVYKTPQNGVPWFAGRLKAKTGIDPLCIAQAWGVPPPDPTLEAADLKAVLDVFNPAAPIVVSDAEGRPIELGHAFDSGIDLSVFHPRLSYFEGRPGWLAKAVGRRAMRFAFPSPAASDGLVQAVPSREAHVENAIPADQLLVSARTREVTFFVKPGAYEIRFETKEGRRALGSLSA